MKLAKQKVWSAFKTAVNSGVEHIAISNVFAHPDSFRCFVSYAKKNSYRVKFYRLQNDFQNTHNVSKEIVDSMKQNIEANPIKGEVIVPKITG